jgi:hypothetical protein
VAPHATTTLRVEKDCPASTTALTAFPTISLHRNAQSIQIDTGPARFEMPVRGRKLVSSVEISGQSLLADRGIIAQLLDAHGTRFETDTEQLVVEVEGSLTATVVASGRFVGNGKSPSVRFTAWTTFTAGSASVQLDFKLWNPDAALHPGGLWDLGDPGSFRFKDLTLECALAESVQTLRWYAEDPAKQQNSAATMWSLYQDSSGGENWKSVNHIDRNGRSTVAFQGYKVLGGEPGEMVELVHGMRATPGITALAGDSRVSVTVRDFWQSFPKALRWRNGALQVALFPQESVGGFELQGGEQKRHTVLLDFGADAQAVRLPELQHPVNVAVDSRWIEQSRAVAWLAAASPDDDPRYASYVNQIIQGSHSFFAKRETIDEYGWRNFGDLYADHEAVHHRGPEPFISHYNNQYDFIYGAFLHFQRTGDARWRQLMEDAARHTIDIDIYRTQGDSAAYNGGLFWHTDHYRPAATSTHRTYSKANGGGGDYGGGPANEQNYSSGLLHYYYLTGDSEAAEAVRLLADWVCAMDDGTRNVLSIIDEGPTGLASSSRDRTYHRAGRGGGNSINTLMDAYAVTRNRRYWQKAEQLLQRCIHPRDDVASLSLDDPENRWSYLVFLQVLGKYLEAKLEMGEIDYMFWYARDSLQRYARWMLDHEVPYKDVLHKVEIPTETWSAHDIRKCHVFHLAARYSSGDESTRLEAKANEFFNRCILDLIGFQTAHFTRPLVILCVHGTVHDYFRRQDTRLTLPDGHVYDFGHPMEFVPQRYRLASTIRRKLRLLRIEVVRSLRQRLYSVRR